MKKNIKSKVKTRKEKPSAPRDSVTGQLIATRLAKLINKSVYIDWVVPKDSYGWHYFIVLEINKQQTKVRLIGWYPESIDVDDFWTPIDDIEDVWRAPSALESMDFKKSVIQMVKDSIGAIEHSITLNGGGYMSYNEEERGYNDGFESGLSQAKEELESLLERIKVG